MNMTTTNYQAIAGLQVATAFVEFVNAELLPNTQIDSQQFWRDASALIHKMAPVNKFLIEKREVLQQKIDAWHRLRQGQHHDHVAYKTFLEEIGYLVPQGPAFCIDTQNVDAEIATVAGPQLVVPVMNARFALNACNARWGSLYDALYGTDVIPGSRSGGGYDPVRGRHVIAYGREFLNDTFPLASGNYCDVVNFDIFQGELVATLTNGEKTGLALPKQFKGFGVPVNDLAASDRAIFLLENNNLHVELVVDKTSNIGKIDAAGISDIILESAITTIMDFEDSVAAVDAEDKILGYRNWLGLMNGSLQEEVTKNGKTFTRRMRPDRDYLTPSNEPFSLPGRSLLFVRNVGHLMTTPLILDKHGEQIPEGIMDGIFTCLAAMHDVSSQSGASPRAIKNSQTGSIYIVKPKMHGPEEVAFANNLFTEIETLLGLPVNAVKMGIMDEERRTSVNLTECIRAAKSRVVFINTGFLDRTGDEIHTSMEAGPFAPKDTIKSLPWIKAYETSNVAAGLLCGLKGTAQIGKGMWAMPDNMAAMMEVKIAQPKAGATTAWVPSPTAATLHAMHYHKVNVANTQDVLLASAKVDVDTILQIPLLGNQTLAPEYIQREIENNAQGLLGYVVRWIDQGIGCSKVPDIKNVALMEDRATLRISSQHICNWLHHKICTPEQVIEILTAMAKVVDKQNSQDPNYQPMSNHLEDSVAFTAAKDLIFKGREQPSGYTEPLLHAYRLDYKLGC